MYGIKISLKLSEHRDIILSTAGFGVTKFKGDSIRGEVSEMTFQRFYIISWVKKN